MHLARAKCYDGRTLTIAFEHGRAFRVAGSIYDPVITDEVVEPVDFLTPLDPVAIVGIAQNYRAHAMEMGGKIPERPVYFMKFPWSAIAADEPIRLPRGLRSDKVDFEAELAVVIGREGRNISREHALDYVLGYTAANDVTARDWQKEWGGGQFCRGKGFDTFCPLGPVLVTPESLPNRDRLKIRCELNGKEMQNSNTSDLIFDIPALIEFLSGSTTLKPGTVILTGTPSGVGTARTPPVYLKPGDRVTVEVEGIGRLCNPVVEETL